jgi:hypothetical protein
MRSSLFLVRFLLLVLLGGLAACEGDSDTGVAAGDDRVDDHCAGEGALASCLSPTQTAEYYASWSSAYFDTMDYRVELDDWPPYGETVARWEWPPWLLLTAYTRENIEATDTLLQAFPSIVEERDCRGFDTQPFGRCRVVFYYDSHEGLGCPIYEEFTFNDAGEITFIEAWSDQPALRPMADDDPWAQALDGTNGEASDVARLSGRIPGLGTTTGTIDLDSDAMVAAVAADADVADFDARARDWYATWLAEYSASDETMWSTGCGW